MSGSRQWVARQRVDEYVLRAAREGYRSRAAYKLLQMNARIKPALLQRGKVALEVGAAPGSWTQVLIKHGLHVVGIDLLPMQPVEGATLLQGDFTDQGVQRQLLAALGAYDASERADLLLSDVAPNRSGNASIDQARIFDCAERSLELAQRCLRPGGSFLCKLLDGAETKPFLQRVKPMFKSSGNLVKPPSSRPRSRELYLVARGFDPDAFAARGGWL